MVIKMLRNFVLVIGCSTLIGCSGTEPKPFTDVSKNNPETSSSVFYICLDNIKDQVDAKLSFEIKKAIYHWDYAMGGWRHLVIKNKVDNDCRVVISIVDEDKCSQASAIACANGVGGNQIWLKRGRYEQDVSGVVMHELGHCFGADHAPDGLMYPYDIPSKFICPDFYAVSMVFSWNHAPMSSFRWCAEGLISKADVDVSKMYLASR